MPTDTMATALRQAKAAWHEADRYADDSAPHIDSGRKAATLAAIASAEALTRIAEVLETMLENDLVRSA